MSYNRQDITTYYTIFQTAPGWVGVLGSAQGLLKTTLPRDSSEIIENLLSADIEKAINSPHRYSNLVERLQSYFAGDRVVFPDVLDLSGTTPFQRLVWETTRYIDYGETRSYSWIARRMSKPRSYRAVGQALGENPLPVVVPCHRVIAADGRLGGFSGGLKIKEALLQMEASGRSPWQ